MATILPLRSAAVLPCCSKPRPYVRLTRVAASSKDETRPIGCSELYNMSDAINAQLQRPDPSSTGSISSTSTSNRPPAAAEGRPAGTQQQAAGAAAASTQQQQQQAGGVAYYRGLLTSDLAQDNAASSSDMLQRSLQLAGGVAVLLGGMVLAFLASNGLLG